MGCCFGGVVFQWVILGYSALGSVGYSLENARSVYEEVRFRRTGCCFGVVVFQWAILESC